MTIGYLIVLGLLLYEAFYARKQNGGYIEFIDLFIILFVSVIIFELFYSVFTLIYLKWIDPDVIDRMKASIINMLDKYGSSIPDERKNSALAKLDKMKEQTQFGSIALSYLISVIISGIFALIFAAIVKRKKSKFE
jgi:hypothetical protein